jgi:hypothetical protein
MAHRKVGDPLLQTVCRQSMEQLGAGMIHSRGISSNAARRSQIASVTSCPSFVSQPERYIIHILWQRERWDDYQLSLL